MEKQSLNKVHDFCLQMSVGRSGSFEIDEEVDHGYMPYFVHDLNRQRQSMDKKGVVMLTLTDQTIHVTCWREADTNRRKLEKPRFLMATKAFAGGWDLSRKTPDICHVFEEDRDYYIGNWLEGFGFVNVRFPKKTTRELTEEEIQKYDGKWWGINDVPMVQLKVT